MTSDFPIPPYRILTIDNRPFGSRSSHAIDTFLAAAALLFIPLRTWGQLADGFPRYFHVITLTTYQPSEFPSRTTNSRESEKTELHMVPRCPRALEIIPGYYHMRLHEVSCMPRGIFCETRPNTPLPPPDIPAVLCKSTFVINAHRVNVPSFWSYLRYSTTCHRRLVTCRQRSIILASRITSLAPTTHGMPPTYAKPHNRFI